MLNLPTHAKIYFHLKPTDMRKSFDGLCGLVESVFEQDVLDGCLFLFVNRRRDRIKALWWEQGGLVLWYKRLEQGTFELPAADEERTHVAIDATQLAMLLGGVPLDSAKRRKRYQPAA